MPAQNSTATIDDHVLEMQRQLLTHHNGANGYVTLFRKYGAEHTETGYYRLEQLTSDELNKWAAGADVYYAQNEFNRKSRRIEYLKELRSVYVDLDVYKLNIPLLADWVDSKLREEAYGRVVPVPNLVIHSGRGLQLVWLIEPRPKEDLPKWQMLENHFVELLHNYGADPQVSDASRILRVAGTFNSKNGANVWTDYLHDKLYDLDELIQQYLPAVPVKPVHKPKSRTRIREYQQVEPERTASRNSVKRMMNWHTLAYARYMDLLRLCELRQWNLHKYNQREVVIFLYRYWQLLFVRNRKDALNNALELNRQFTKPLSENEVMKSTESAERMYDKLVGRENDAHAAKAKMMGYAALGYNYSNRRLIKLLGIQPEEELHLNSIISKREKYRRYNEKRETKRREQGIKPIEQIRSRATERDELILKLANEGMSRRQIAKEVGCGKTTVDRAIEKYILSHY